MSNQIRTLLLAVAATTHFQLHAGLIFQGVIDENIALVIPLANNTKRKELFQKIATIWECPEEDFYLQIGEEIYSLRSTHFNLHEARVAGAKDFKALSYADHQAPPEEDSPETEALFATMLDDPFYINGKIEDPIGTKPEKKLINRFSKELYQRHPEIHLREPKSDEDLALSVNIYQLTPDHKISGYSIDIQGKNLNADDTLHKKLFDFLFGQLANNINVSKNFRPATSSQPNRVVFFVKTTPDDERRFYQVKNKEVKFSIWPLRLTASGELKIYDFKQKTWVTIESLSDGPNSSSSTTAISQQNIGYSLQLLHNHLLALAIKR